MRRMATSAGDREGEGEAGAAGWGVTGADGTAVGVHDGRADREPDAARGPVTRAEGLEHRVAQAGVEPGAVVGDRDDHSLASAAHDDIDGIDVCRHLRRWLPSPVIVLTADGAEDRKILALDEGADDYVTKPFSMPELLARVRVAVRHRRALSAVVDADLLLVGDLRIDVAAHEAWLGEDEIHLPRKEFALLALLARNAGRVLTHATLLRQVWPERQGDDDTQVLRTHVTVLRRKLGLGPLRPRIVSEPGVGYRLVVDD